MKTLSVITIIISTFLGFNSQAKESSLKDLRIELTNEVPRLIQHKRDVNKYFSKTLVDKGRENRRELKMDMKLDSYSEHWKRQWRMKESYRR